MYSLILSKSNLSIILFKRFFFNNYLFREEIMENTNDRPVSRCSLKTMVGDVLYDVVDFKRQATGEQSSMSGEGGPGYRATPGTLDYNLRAAIGGFGGALRGLLMDLPEDIGDCFKKGLGPNKKSIDGGATPAP
jgi:hypothetical protein